MSDATTDDRRMEAVGRLVGGIAHGFNNLLTVVAGNADLLLRELQEGDPGHEEMVEIRDAARRGQRLTRDLLAFARQENLRLRTVDLVSAFEELRPEIESALGDGVTLELRLDAGPVRVRVDPDLAREVLLEIVANARDAMPDGGHFRIELRRLRVAPGSKLAGLGLEPGRWVAVGYSDTGTGMAEAVRERALEPFFSTRDGRSGLGLSMVHGLVKQSDGEVRIESAPGEGTTVWTYLPEVEASAGRPDRSPA